MKYVPQHIKFENAKSPQKPAQIVEDLDEWINELNKYSQENIRFQEGKLGSSKINKRRRIIDGITKSYASWGRSVIVNCYGDGGNISSESALAYLNDEDRIKRSKGDPLAFEGVSSDPRDKEVSNWLLKYNIQRFWLTNHVVIVPQFVIQVTLVLKFVVPIPLLVILEIVSLLVIPLM